MRSIPRGGPFSFAADFPDPYANLSNEERDAKAIIASDQCILDSQWFFLRGMIEIPILGSDEPFLWGVWASIRQEVFDEISDSWEEQGRETKYGPSSREISTQRLGRASGLSRWYSLPLRRIEMESQTAATPPRPDQLRRVQQLQ